MTDPTARPSARRPSPPVSVVARVAVVLIALTALPAACGTRPARDELPSAASTGSHVMRQATPNDTTLSSADSLMTESLAVLRADSAVPASGVLSHPLDRPRRTAERSAAAVSLAEPGVFYTINDSGNEPDLFAFDSTGASRGAWRVNGVRNVDWEALAVARCALGDTDSTAIRSDASSCVYIGDVGDNGERRRVVAIYRVREPLDSKGKKVDVDAIVVRYPDRPHNVEAMYVAPDGALMLVTKEGWRPWSMERVRSYIYRVSSSAWSGMRDVTASLADSLPSFPGDARAQMVTDAAISADGEYLSIRTYQWLATFRLDRASGLPREGTPPALCDLGPLRERQGEGVGMLGADDGRFVFTSEGRDEPLRLATCPLPAR